MPRLGSPRAKANPPRRDSRRAKPPFIAMTAAAQNRWLSVDEARAKILARIEPIDGEEKIPLRESLGRILARDVAAPFDVPGHDNSAMDGFACRFADLRADEETALAVVGESFAGSPFAGKIKKDQCARIMTGAKIPAGADAVIPQEETRFEGGTAIILPARKRKRGMHLRRAGEDMKKGGIALAAGRILRAAEIGLLASLGKVEVAVKPRLRVAFFSTGDELRSLGEPIQKGEIYDSNRHTIFAMLAACGFAPVDLGAVADNREALARALDAGGEQADAIITSGGVSVGAADFVREAVAARGKVLFWKVAMRPGRPLAYGKIRDPRARRRTIDFFGLPGNPVSVMVCFCLFAREALFRRAGCAEAFIAPTVAAIAETDLKTVRGRAEYLRAVLSAGDDGVWRARATGDQGSGILSSMTAANCFVVLPPESEGVKAGDKIRALPFSAVF